MITASVTLPVSVVQSRFRNLFHFILFYFSKTNSNVSGQSIVNVLRVLRVFRPLKMMNKLKKLEVFTSFLFQMILLHAYIHVTNYGYPTFKSSV